MFLKRIMGETGRLKVLFFVQILVISELYVHGRYVPANHVNLENSEDPDVKVAPTLDVDSYLERYGYLVPPPGDSDDRPAYDEATRSSAIMYFQRFAQLKETGTLNPETVTAMRRPRCGVADIQPHQDPSLPLQFNTGGTQWSSSTIRWFISNYTDKLTRQEQRLGVENAMFHWSSVCGINIEPANSSADADIILRFAAGNHGDGVRNAFDGRGGVLGHAYPPEDGAAHFDQDERWVFHSNRGTEFETVATHEIGHSLGLTHSMTRGAVMAPFSFPYWPGFTLHADDIAGVQSLYGPPQTTTTTAATTTAMSTTTPTTTTTTPVPTTRKPRKPQRETEGTRSNGSGMNNNTLCSTKFDAITKGPDGFIDVFIGRNLYRLMPYCHIGRSCIKQGYPVPIRKVYKKGPAKVRAAAYIPDHRKRTYLFKGRKIWRFTNYKLDQGYPKLLNSTAMPYKPTAAYVHKNQFADYQLYLFGKKRFWEMSLYTESMVEGPMSVDRYWNRMPGKPDAMLQTADGNIYVFRKQKYRKYNHLREVIQKKSKPIGPSWIGGDCGFDLR